MRYTSALVLGTLAAGQAAAHTIRHAEFHARKAAEAKRDLQDVDWSKVDYSSVDWSKIDWDAVFNKKQAAPGPEPSNSPEPTPAPSQDKPKVQDKPEENKSPIQAIGDFLEGLTDGIEDFCKQKGISNPGKNDKSPNGGIWLGHSEWSANFHNAGKEDVWVTCWKENSFTGMTINVNQPEILIKIPVGGNQTVSFAPKVASACAPIYSDTQLANFGGVNNPWFEANFGPTDGSFVGTFDVSKNVNMNGDIIEAHGSKCVSDMNTCVFECKDKSVQSCTTGYELRNCGASNGGGQG
ncbi:uncharacterized protein EI97DRAFT_361017, partial [Westerdykella ornata]